MKQRAIRTLHDDERGVILVFVVVLMSVLLGMLALVVDVGNARQQRRQAQTAADASALAGAEVIAWYRGDFSGAPSQWTAVVDQVKGYAQQNWDVLTEDWVGCTDADHLAYTPDGSNTCISADFSLWSAPLPGDPVNTVNRLRVKLPERDLTSFFGSIFDVDSLSTSATATASVTRTTSTISVPDGPCALCVLSPTGLTLDGQNGDVSITGGGVVVNSTASTAASLNPNGNVRITVPCDDEGNCQTIGGPGAPANFSGSGFSPTPVLKDPVVDPLRDVPQCGDGGRGEESELEPLNPPPTACPTNVVPTAAKKLASTLSPGIYEHGIEGSHTLQPGVYVLKDDIVLNGNDLLEGDGVMLYLACDDYPNPCAEDEVGAGITSTGNGSLRLTAPTSGTYQGLTIFADRNNTAVQTFRGNATNESGPQSGSSGTMYVKSGTVDLRGNGYTLSSLIITNTFSMNGNPSGVTIAYDLDKNYAVDTTGTRTETSYTYDATGLVE